MMYSAIIAGMTQAQVAQERIEFQRRMEEMEPYRAAGREALEKLEMALRGDVAWSGVPSHTGTHIGSAFGSFPRLRPISCRSCGANVSSIEQACSYCKTER